MPEPEAELSAENHESSVLSLSPVPPRPLPPPPLSPLPLPPLTLRPLPLLLPPPCPPPPPPQACMCGMHAFSDSAISSTHVTRRLMNKLETGSSFPQMPPAGARQRMWEGYELGWTMGLGSASLYWRTTLCWSLDPHHLRNKGLENVPATRPHSSFVYFLCRPFGQI